LQFPERNFIEIVSAQDDQSKLATFRMAQPKINQPKAVIVMYHGMGDHTQKMSYIAKEFFDRGYDVIGYDSYGFGLSEGT